MKNYENILLTIDQNLTESTSITNGFLDNYEKTIYKLFKNKIVNNNSGENID